MYTGMCDGELISYSKVDVALRTSVGWCFPFWTLNLFSEQWAADTCISADCSCSCTHDISGGGSLEDVTELRISCLHSRFVKKEGKAAHYMHRSAWAPRMNMLL